MPGPGGQTTQAGIYYQNSITALYLGRMLGAATDRQVVRVRAEAPDQVDDTVAAYGDGGRDFVQAKLSVPSGKPWEKLWRAVHDQRRTTGFDRGLDRLILAIGEPSRRAAQLAEMAKRTTGSDSPGTWLKELNKEHRDLLVSVEKSIPGSTTEDVYTIFSVMDVDVRTLENLENDRVPLDIPESTKLRRELYRLLRDRVGGNARYRVVFDRRSLLASLQKDDPNFAIVPAADVATLAAAARAVGDVLRAHKGSFGRTGRHVTRPAVAEIVTWAQSHESAGAIAMLLDDAGRGKSVVVRDVLASLDTAGVTTIAVKADVQLSGIGSPEEIQKRLQLPDSLQRVITALGRNDGPVVLLFDQIDALSHNLAQDSKTLDIVLDTVVRAARLPHVRVILSCRAFDAGSDPRLRRLDVRKEFRLGELPEDDVKATLADAGVSYDDLTLATKVLLRTPLHLDIFVWLKARGGTPERTAPAALQNLYSALMTDFVLRAETQAPPAMDRERALLQIADAMAMQQRTTVPLSIFRGDAALDRAITWLASNGIVIVANDRATFLHQTFFDYLYARRFVDRGDSLVEHILASPQGLRQRTELVQILTYARGAAPADYLRWLDALFHAPNLRPHLKRLLIRLFGRVAAPTLEEVVWVSVRLANANERSKLLDGMHGNGAWLSVLLPVVEALLTSGDDGAVNDALTFLASVADAAQREVIAFLARFVDEDESWRRRIMCVLNLIRTWTDPAAVELFEAVLARDAYSMGRFYEFRDMAELHPTSFARIARTLLTRAGDEALAAGGPASFTYAFDKLGQTDFDRAISKLADAQSTIFLDALLPWFVDALEKTSSVSRPEFFRSDQIGFLWEGGSQRTIAVITSAIVTALVGEVASDDAGVRMRLATLAQIDNDTVQALLATLYARVPHYANEAIEFLLGDVRRLALGQAFGCARRLIAGAVPHARAELVHALADTICAYRGVWALRGLDDLRRTGLEQYLLLAAFPRECLSPAGKRRHDELQRKFPQVSTAIEAEHGELRAVWERPPITPDRAQRMSDNDWLRAMAKYQATDDPFRSSPRQLADTLKAAVQADRARFTALFDRLPNDTADVYVEALVQSLGEAYPVLPPAVIQNVLRFSATAGLSLRRMIAWTLQKHPDDMHDALLDVLEAWVRNPSLDTEPDQTSVDYLNPDRGAAFLALMYALRARNTPAAQARRWRVFEYVTTQSVPFLRAAGIEELRYELFDDAPAPFVETNEPPRAMQHARTSRRTIIGVALIAVFALILTFAPLSARRRLLLVGTGAVIGALAVGGVHVRRRLKARDSGVPPGSNARRALETFDALLARGDEPLGGYYADDFLRLALGLDAILVLTVIERMLKSKEAALRERGAFLMAITAVSTVLSWWSIWKARRAVAAVLAGSETEQRVAITKVLAHNIDGPAGGYCMQRLKNLLADSVTDIRAAIGVIFSEAPTATLRHKRFLKTYAASPAIVDAQYVFGEFLLDHLQGEPAFGLELIENALPRFDDKQPPHGDEFLRYVLRVTSSPLASDSLQRCAMDVFDQVDARFGRFSSNLLAEWDQP